jgi:cytochrome c553
MTPDMIRSPNRFLPLLTGCLILLASLAAHAQTPVTGSAKTGEQLTYTCQGCHGITGYKNAYPSYQVPKIRGQKAEYLINALTEYKRGSRKHPTMQAQAQSFSEQDIADIAAYLSSPKK